jgi:putative phage-type endonuclease
VTDRAQWLEERRTGIGGSDIAPILGLSKYRTALEVYKEKIGELSPDEEANADRKRLGHRLQLPIIEEYCEAQSARIVEYEPPMIRHPDLPFLIGNLDAVVQNEFADEWNVDAKSVHFRLADHWGESGTDDIPDDAFYQGHAYNFLSPKTRHKTDFAVLVGGEWPPRVYSVPRDDEFVALLIPTLEKFWWHVTNREEVPPDFAHETTLELMKRLYPEVDPAKTLELPENFHGLAERYYALGKVQSIAKDRRDLMQGELLFSMGDAAVATIKNSPFYLARTHVGPSACKRCGFQNRGGFTKFEIRLAKAHKGHVPALEAAAQKLIEGGTD